MSDAAPRDGTSTVTDYEAFLESRRDDERFELIRGRIVMVTNPSEDHAQLVGNLFAPLKAAMHVDRGAKFDFYRSLPSLQHIVLVYQRQVRVEHFRRAAENWPPFELLRSTDRLDLDALDLSIALDALHRGVPAVRAAGPPGDPTDEEPTLPIR